MIPGKNKRTAFITINEADASRLRHLGHGSISLGVWRVLNDRALTIADIQPSPDDVETGCPSQLVVDVLAEANPLVGVLCQARLSADETEAKRLIRNGRVRINGNAVKSVYRTVAVDTNYTYKVTGQAAVRIYLKPTNGTLHPEN